MVVLEYILVFVSGSEECLSLFNRWFATQDCINYVTCDEFRRDVYQIKPPLSLWTAVDQARRVGCTLALR